MFGGIISDLCEDKWESMGDPPENLSTLKGYTKYAISQRSPVSSNSILLYLSTEDGILVKGVMPGVLRDPVKGIRNFWAHLEEKAEGKIITAVALEGDWVEMKSEYLSTFKDKVENGNADHEEESKLSESIFEGRILRNFVDGKWESKGKPPAKKVERAKLGYYDYIISRVEKKPNNVGECLICLDGGFPKLAMINGINDNPFGSIMNATLKMKTLDGKSTIIGIIVEDSDWIEMK